MDSSYIPAIITGVAGIAGIVINVSVNTWYRYCDIREKRKEKNILAYEIFYVPLSDKLLVLQSTIDVLPNIDLKVVGEYLRNENPPANLRNQINDIYIAAKNVREFVDNNSFKYITDYKIKVYYDKIIECVTALCRAKENHEVFPDGVFEVNHIKELINRIDCISINIFTSNISYRIYLRKWRNKQ